MPNELAFGVHRDVKDLCVFPVSALLSGSLDLHETVLRAILFSDFNPPTRLIS